MPAAAAPANSRQRLIVLIHVAKRDLGYDEPTYRQVLLSAGKADSTSKMGVPALMAVLERMKKSGFAVRPKRGDRPQTISPPASKVRALWLFLHALGAVQDPSEAALAAFVRRIAKVDDLRWVRGAGFDTLIEAEKMWAMRFLPDAVRQLRAEVGGLRNSAGLTPEQVKQLQEADSFMERGKGFDSHWWAWEAFMLILGRPVAGELRQIGGAA